MDVRASLNADDFTEVVTGEGETSIIDNDSFFARVPPQAASTVGRTKARRHLQESEMGSFLEDTPHRATPVNDDPKQLYLSFSGVDAGARPKVTDKPGLSRSDTGAGDQRDDWSVVNEWCRDNKHALDKFERSDTDQDGKSSLGIIDIDDMDFSSNNLLLEAPLDELMRRDGGRDACLQGYTNLYGTKTKETLKCDPVKLRHETSSQPSIYKEAPSSDSANWKSDSSYQSTVKEAGSSDSAHWRSGSSAHTTLKEQVSGDSNHWRSEGSSNNDSKPDQPFARSQIGTVKKNETGPAKQDPITTAIRQSLFGQMPIEEEGDTSVYNVELAADDLHQLDADFGEMNCSLGDDSDKEDQTPAPCTSDHPTGITQGTVEDFQLDSIYLRPCLAGEEQMPHSKLPYLSKVSLFDGGSGSEIDTEDELEMARKAQGMRHEAAGEASLEDLSRPGLVGGSSDNTRASRQRQLPITQRQSAEGDVVSSPVPGDGGGGGDGTSGSESDDGRSNVGHHSNTASTQHRDQQSQRVQPMGDQEQRIRPMGDDLLSEIRFNRSNPSERVNSENDDSRLHARYLAAISPVEVTQGDNFNIDDFLSSQHQTDTDHDFDPGNRLEASGFNADDASAINDKGSNSDPFGGVMASSFGSFGLDPSGSDMMTNSAFGDNSGPTFSMDGMGNSFNTQRMSGQEGGEDMWAQLESSVGTSLGSKHSSIGALSHTSRSLGEGPQYARHSTDKHSTDRHSKDRQSRDNKSEVRTSGSLGRRSAASGSPTRGNDANRAGTPNSPDSSVSGYSSAGSEHKNGAFNQESSFEMGDLHQQRAKPDVQNIPSELKDKDIFKKPTMPAPKAANTSSFKKSLVKPKMSPASSSGTSGRSSTRSSQSGASTKSDGSEWVDLAFRMSLTGQASEQHQGLKRVPSMGGTTEMDLTVADDDFFANDEALAMLNADEDDFQKDHVFIQDDAMVDTGSPNDSWAYKSIMSVARPSWMEDIQDEEKVMVRISVGSYMRGRTEALGTLGGDDDTSRPDFGMKIQSPPKVQSAPSRLIEEENSVFERTSGVGEYGPSGTPKRTCSEDIVDTTLTMDSLLQTPSDKTLMAVSTLDIDALRLKQFNKTIASGDSSKLSMGELSILMKQGDDPKTRTERLLTLQSLKYKSKHKDKSNSKADTVPLELKSSTKYSPRRSNTDKTSPQRSSNLPVRKGSNVSRSFPKVDDYEISSLKTDSLSKKKMPTSYTDSGLKRSLETESVVTNASPIKEADSANVAMDTDLNLSPKPSAENNDFDNVWASPNESNYCGSTSGLLDRLEEFKFNDQKNDVRKNLNSSLGEALKQNLRAQYCLPDTTGSGVGTVGMSGSVRDLQDRVQTDREKTPPPDGQDRYTASTAVKMSRNIDQESSDKSRNNQNISKNFNGTAHDNNQVFTNSINQYNRFSSGSNNSDDNKRLGSNNGNFSKKAASLHESENKENEISRLNFSDNDHGYMPGHHIPDGSEYSQRSDYAHMDHKGMSREDVAGVEDIGLAESRGFDMLKQNKHKLRSQNDGSERERVGEVLSARAKLLDSNMSGSVYNRSQNVHLQPTQSVSPMTRNGASHIPNLHTSTAPSCGNSEDTESQSKRHESWTQTSLVFDQGLGLQSNLNPTLDTASNHHKALRNDSTQNRDVNVYTSEPSKVNQISGIPPKMPVSSFKHNLLSQGQTTQSDKLHLLTKTSLMQTEFARENLKQKYSVETMDKIYSSNIPPESFMEMSSIMPSQQESYKPTSFSHSTPFVPSTSQRQLSSTNTRLNNNQSQLSSGCLSMMDGNMATPAHNSGPGVNPSLCPVEAPGVLQFCDACCVGISKKEVLRLKNPTDRWMECHIQVRSLEIDGRGSSLDNLPFDMRERKVIIDPHKTETIDVMFLPKFAGAFVAHVQVFSHSFLKKDDVNTEMIPVNVTFQAIAEEPWIKVSCDEQENKSIQFGEMTWGSCKEKTICIRNMGHATVPLRLAITSNKAWHCFSFEPEGRMSDVSMISGKHPPTQGHGKSIINISLPGANQPFSYHEVRVWCRPPDKQCNKVMARAQPEEFSCNIDVEVDIPYSKLPKLFSLVMKAIVGVHKLHIESNLSAITMSTSVKKCRETRVKVYNAGNLNLNVSFGFSEHKDIYTVTPGSISLRPGVDAELQVSFKPTDMSRTKYDTLLLMLVHPQGPMYELHIHGDVVKDNSNIATSILCDCQQLDFSGVALGKTVVKRYQLINKGVEPVTMAAEVRVDDVLIAKSPDANCSGTKKRSLFLEPEEIVPVYVVYSPSTSKPVSGKIIMRPVNCNTKYTVRISGYGGVSKLSCSEDSTDPVSVRGYPCVRVKPTSVERVQQVYVNNTGDKPANVNISVYKDLDCSHKLLSGEIVVQPSKFTVHNGDSTMVEIVVCINDADVTSQPHQVVGALCFNYHDAVDAPKPHRSKLVVGLVRSMWSELSNDSNMTLDPQPTLDKFATPSLSQKSLRLTTQLPSSGRESYQNTHNIPKVPRNTYTSKDHIQQNYRGGNMNNTQSTRYGSSLGTEPMSNGTNTLSTEQQVTTQVASPGCDGFQMDNSGGWNIRPHHIVLYCSRTGPSEELDKFHINNNRNRDISFEISLPGMVSLTPDRGTVRARENKGVCIYPSTQACQSLDQLPWSGNVLVTCDDIVKTLKVEIHHDPSGDDRPVPDECSNLVAIPTNPHAMMSNNNRLGALQVSSTIVQFPLTLANKTSKDSIELINTSDDTLRWMFSSFASPYLSKRADNTKEMFRVSYKVFDFSRQFGKLAPHSSIQLSLQFMPRSTGTFSQYWDLQTSGNMSQTTSQKHDFIRIHFTGEGMEDSDNKSTRTNTVDNIVPRMASDTYRLTLMEEHVKFPCLSPGQSNTQKVQLKNSHLEDVQVEVTTPRPPFYVRHPKFKIAKKRYLRLPLEFQPSRPGKYKDVIKFQASTGENLMLQVYGECS